uniref:Uncharacterized protein n=1 Tax=Arundo donax TaxID=35708 RepID=A0A0A9FXN9_ARUDO
MLKATEICNIQGQFVVVVLWNLVFYGNFNNYCKILLLWILKRCS